MVNSKSGHPQEVPLRIHIVLFEKYYWYNQPVIKILSKNIVNKIAAGEVVERPASVVKELVENSIDAGSTEIKIIIEEFGTKKIQIIDNGSGIAREDFDNLFHKHATSKINDIEDLDTIRSFGFRGEALASISSVAEIILATKSSNDEMGSEIHAINGKIEKIIPSQITSGTNIQILNLFENIPARKKFLKSKSTENKAILDIINKFILANPQIHFEYKIDGSEKKFPAEVSANRISKILNLKSNELIPIQVEGNIVIKGFLIHPNVFMKNRNSGHIFVNSRNINDQLIAKAVKDGYDTFMMKNQYPGYVLFIELNPEKVDVNVHPRKTEVRFQNSSEIYTSVRFGVNKTLLSFIKNQTHSKIAEQNHGEAVSNSNNSFTVNEPKSEYRAFSSDDANSFETFLQSENSTSLLQDSSKQEAFLRQAQDKSGIISQAIEFSGELIQSDFVQEATSPSGLSLDLENATQLLNSYIITSNKEEIILVDQHAASERYFYEKFLKDLKSKKVDSQVLLFPEIYTFEDFDIDKILKEEKLFEKFGFKIEEFGKNQIKIIQVPAFLKLKNFEKIFRKISTDILENTDSSNIDHKIEHEIAAILACHTAVRFGDRLTKPEIIQILKNLLLCKDPYNCPHGRPIIQDHSQYDIEKRFKRCGI